MIKSKINILLIIPYFGRWPKYFNIFLKSCENNDWLDILFFTDCEIPNVKSPHVRFHNFNLVQFSNLATIKLGHKINVINAYKLCDFKPCYGLIFEDYLKNYDYWGYGDIDLVFGNLKPYIIDRIEQGYDVLSNRAEILSGSLTVFRNTANIKNLYAQSPKLICLLQTKKYEGLDETAFDNRTWNGGKKNDLPQHCFTYIIDNENSLGKINASFITTCKEEINKKEIININNSQVTFEEKQLAYYHYVCNKNKEEYIFPNWSIVPDNFFISATGFYRNEKFYTLINISRKILGFITNISGRIWKRVTKFVLISNLFIFFFKD